MMFMMPMPPTTSETDAMAARSRLSTREDASWLSRISERLRSVKSSSWWGWSRCRWRRSVRSSCSTAFIAAASRAFTRIVPTARALA
jgi:hypothetical protein